MYSVEELLAAVHRLTAQRMSTPVCGTAGHAAGHVCLVPSARIALPDLRKAISSRFGEPRSLVAGGIVDPAASVRTGLPLLTPFGERVVEMRAWACGDRWVGCGTTHHDDGDDRLVVLVAERENPAAGLDEAASWVDRVVALTGWETTRVRTVGWAAVEARLGTALPSDYKRLIEIFGGPGAFDDYVQLQVPDAHVESMDIVRHTEWLGEWARTEGSHLRDPYPVYPAAGGVLKWAGTEQAEEFYWLTGDPDPDKWPVLAHGELRESWIRFNGTTAEFIHHMLTDLGHPFSMARWYDVHWYQDYGHPVPP
ncbi:hypothetical protein [Streptomyces sp. NPDC059781]|uniref:hypothetical protein n=1 Tax=Streptomyces sp. NPDC059781 TaxID=3346943 RepID=UPI00366833C7